MTQRRETKALSVLIVIAIVVILVAMFHSTVKCTRAGGTPVRGMLWVACIHP